MIPLSPIVASYVAHPLTWLILRGGMLADIVVVARLLGDDRSKAVRVVWLAALLCLGGAWLTLTIWGVARATLPASTDIRTIDTTTTLLMRLKCYPLLNTQRSSDETCRVTHNARHTI
jgi:hypothetical protein